ncbi:hypothetical protein [Sphingomonas sp.]|uniref:hypothetical protein n=1 Tax=Sphingomonas sp. TaxID=28214 RepID=UPI0035C85072
MNAAFISTQPFRLARIIPAKKQSSGRTTMKQIIPVCLALIPLAAVVSAYVVVP